MIKDIFFIICGVFTKIICIFYLFNEWSIFYFIFSLDGFEDLFFVIYASTSQVEQSFVWNNFVMCQFKNVES